MLDRRISYPLWAGFAAFVALAASSTLSISGQAQTASRTGKELFEKRCGGCHALDRDKEGPRLGGVYGREAASIPSFEYSAALKKSKLKWTEETLDKWLRAARDYLLLEAEVRQIAFADLSGSTSP